MNSFLLFGVLFVSFAAINSQTIYDVTKYGADNKGVQKSTDAVKKAIDAAAAKGGVVLFPNGQYLTGPISLKSGVTLQLGDQAVVKFSKDIGDYPPLTVQLSDGTRVTKFTPLISAFNQQNIGIKGKGVLDGQGSYWWPTEDARPGWSNSNSYMLNFLRPPFIHFGDCKNILIQDVTVQNSPFWTVNPVYSDGVTITGIKIVNPVPSPNTDGINSYSNRNVLISKVSISTSDDCIALDSGIRKVNRPAENIVITDCQMGNGHAGVAIGSSVSGGVRNVTVKNCVFTGTDRGLYVKTNRDRGGTVEDIHYSNVTINNIQDEGIVLSMVYSANGQNAALHAADIPRQAVTEDTPIIRNIDYIDIKGSAVYSIYMVGVPESLIQNIKLTNVNIQSTKGTSFKNTKNVVLNGKTIS